jgi:hypothetical protein
VAEPLTLTEVERLPVTPYRDVRSQLQSGDLLFCSGRYPFSRAIQAVTRSAWSHVGIVFHMGSIDRKLVLESVEDAGVRLAPLAKYLVDYEHGQPYDGPVVVARFQAINTEMVVRLGQFGVDELTRPYDRDEIGRIAARLILGESRPADDRGFVCSELVHYCFKNAGYEFARNRHGFISPGDIWADMNVTPLARIL